MNQVLELDAQSGRVEKAFEVPCDFDLAFGPTDDLYCSSFSGQLWRIDLDTAESKLVVGDSVKAIAADSTSIYWGAGGNGLMRKGHTSDVPETLFSGDAVNGGLALRDGGAYFVGDFLWRVDTSSFEATMLTPGNDGGGLVAVDGSAAWFTLWDSSFVRSVELPGGSAKTLTTEAKGVDVIQLDDRYVFFTDNVGNALYRIVR